MTELQNSKPNRAWPWIVCLFLLFATALSYLDRQALSVVAPRISDEMGLDNAQLGKLLSAFFFAYGFMHLFIGFFLDRFNIRIVYALFVALWSVSQAAAGLARGFGHLYGARLALGIFEAAGQPGAARIIARIVPAKDRSLANGIMMSGGSLGAMISGPLMILLANTVGWRGGFMILGGLGLLWAVLFFLWFRPGTEVLYGRKAGDKTLREEDQWRVILRNPRFWACVVGATFCIPIIHIASAWIPTYFVQHWGLELKRDLAIALFVIYLGLDLGFVGSGAAVSFFTRAGQPVGRARKRVLAVAGVLMLSVCLIPASPSVLAAVMILVCLNVGRAAYGAIFLSFNQDIASGRVGTIAGLMGAVGSFSGALMVWGIGIVSKDQGLAVPFMLMGGLALAGLIPLLVVRWDDPAAPGIDGGQGRKLGGAGA